MDDDDRDALRALWLSEGGRVDGVREFHALARRSGIGASFRDVSAFLRTLGLLPEVERQLDALWAERESSAKELYDRAKREKIPVTSAQIDKYVKDAPERTSERFQTPKQTGRAFANEPWSEWKADIVYATTRPSPPYRYILIRINSFSREVDAEPLEALKDPDMAAGLEALLKRSTTRPPRVLLTDMGSEFTHGEVQDVLRDFGVVHEGKQPGDYGAFSILDAAIGRLKMLIRTEAFEKKKPWAEELPRLIKVLNQRPNPSTGVRPEDVVPSARRLRGKQGAEQRQRAEQAQFWIYGHMAENIQHNFRQQHQRKELLRKKGGVRLQLQPRERDEDPRLLLQRRRGPRKRIDDPRYGDTQRLRDDDFSFGQARTEAGEESNLKLVMGSVPPAVRPGPLGREIVEALEGLRARVMERGPQPFESAVQFLRLALAAEDDGEGKRALRRLDAQGGLTRVLRSRGFEVGDGWVVYTKPVTDEDSGIRYRSVQQNPGAAGLRRWQETRWTPSPPAEEIVSVPQYTAAQLEVLKDLEAEWERRSGERLDRLARARRYQAKLPDGDALPFFRTFVRRKWEERPDTDPLDILDEVLRRYERGEPGAGALEREEQEAPQVIEISSTEEEEAEAEEESSLPSSPPPPPRPRRGWRPRLRARRRPEFGPAPPTPEQALYALLISEGPEGPWAGASWAELLLSRPPSDFYKDRRVSSQTVQGPLHNDLVRFLRALEGPAAEAVREFLGYLPSDRYTSGHPRLQHLSRDVINSLIGVVGSGALRGG